MYYKKEYIGSRLWKNKKCSLCGKFIDIDDKFYMIIFTKRALDVKNECYIDNAVVHKAEFDKLELDFGIMTEELIREYVKLTKKRKHKNEKTSLEIETICKFKETLQEMGFDIFTENGTIVKCSQRKPSVYVSLDYRTHSISISHKGKKNPFDFIYDQEILKGINDKLN